MMLYKNSKAIVHSTDSDTDFFDIVAEDLQRDILASYILKISLDYVLRMSIDLIKASIFTLKKFKKQTIFYRNYDRRRQIR